MLARAAELKADPLASGALRGRTVALIFGKPSTRTRISMEAGVVELGGHPMVLRTDDLQLTRGESLADTARVLGRHVAVVGIRTHADAELRTLADAGGVPVLNLLTQLHHPCQVVADLLTLQEAFPERLAPDGGLDGQRLAYVGDGANNMARSLALMGARVGLEVAIAAPAGFQLEADAGAVLVSEPAAAAEGAIAVYTDVWVSMGDEDADARRAALAPYRLDARVLDLAEPGAVALHCLPAHPGEEIAEDLLHGERQRIWDQAENRRHAQKAMLEWLVRAGPFGG